VTRRSDDLQSYIRHVDLFGPDCVLETAAADGLANSDLTELRGYIAHRERTQFWFVGRDEHQGGWWKDRRGRKPRACEHCGLDLPVDARRNMRFHPHCRSAAARVRAADRYASRHGIKLR
jgi:hypothetical protein